jgi:hypothetical protein
MEGLKSAGGFQRILGEEVRADQHTAAFAQVRVRV